MTRAKKTLPKPQDHWQIIVLKSAVLSRFLILTLILLWRSLLSPYDTSAPLNQNCRSSTALPSPPQEQLLLWPSMAYSIESSIVWDGVYFVRIGQCGYEYEQSYAFLPLLPLCIAFFSRTVFAPLVPFIGQRTVLGLSGYVINNIAFVFAAIYFYRLSVAILKDRDARLELQSCFASIQLQYSIPQYIRRVCMLCFDWRIVSVNIWEKQYCRSLAEWSD